MHVIAQPLINSSSVASDLALWSHSHYGGIYPCVLCLNSLTIEEWDENKLRAASLSKIKSKPELSLEFMEAFSSKERFNC